MASAVLHPYAHLLLNYAYVQKKKKPVAIVIALGIQAVAREGMFFAYGICVMITHHRASKIKLY